MLAIVATGRCNAGNSSKEIYRGSSAMNLDNYTDLCAIGSVESSAKDCGKSVQPFWIGMPVPVSIAEEDFMTGSV